MDNHPIPQDVTGFQFKLIGTMTVKQFGYVASGVIMAVILYYLPLNSLFGILFKLFFIPLLGTSGVIVAFVPLEGRPIDVMAANFIKAVFSPNQYMYQRQGHHLSFTTIAVAKVPMLSKTQKKEQHQATTSAERIDEKTEKLRALLESSSHEQIKNESDKKEAAFLNTLTMETASPTQSTSMNSLQENPANTTVVSQTQKQSTSVSVQPLPSPMPQTTPSQPIKGPEKNDLSKLEVELEEELSRAKQEESASKTTESRSAAMRKISVLTKQIQEIHAQKQQLEQELTNLQKQLATEKNSASIPNSPTQPIQDPAHVRTVSQAGTKTVGLPNISDSPNVVVGIVKDPRGNILSNILVEVKDKDGNPVRAFKTNPLGQFASATPLSPGIYTIELEDPKKQQRFDVIQITANNQIMLPIEIISHDAREELRKELFAT